MEGPRHQFLADAALAPHEDGDVDRCHALDGGPHGRHPGIQIEEQIEGRLFGRARHRLGPARREPLPLAGRTRWSVQSGVHSAS